MELTFVDFLITKTDTQADGTVIVKGPCTTDDIDSDRQIVDPEFAARKLPKWLATGGNVRQMHAAKAIGGGMTVERDGNMHILTAHIIDPTACKLTTPHPVTGVRVLRAFSVGISGAKIVKDARAPGGRIVDGEFAEVSLVDRPANAMCKVDLVHKALGSDSAVFTDILVKADDTERPDCKTCHGSGKIKDGNMDCPDCTDGKMSPESTKALRFVEGAVYKKDYSTAERAEMAKNGKALPDGSYPIGDKEDLQNAYTLAASGHGDVPAAKSLIARRAKELDVPNPFEDDSAKKVNKKGTVPPVDQEVTQHLNDADDDLNQAQAAQQEDNDAHENGADDGDDDSMDKGAVPYVLKRLHDHICAAFSIDAVKGAYPAVARFADVVDSRYWSSAVTEIIDRDAGTGAYAGDMAKMSEMYGIAVNLGKEDNDIINEARAALHDAFKAMYPSVHLSPGSITPGQFKRPYISSGRANQTAAAGQKPRLPMQDHVPTAGQFDRGYIQPGHAADSPSAGPPNTATKIDKLDCTQTQVVTDDSLVIVKMIHTPTGCTAQGATVKDAWKNLKDVVKGRQFYTNNAKDQASSMMASLHDYICAVHPDICPMAAKKDDAPEMEPAPDDGGSVDNSDTGAPKEVQMAASALLLKSDDPDLLSKVQGLIDSAVGDLTKKFKKQKNKLEAKLADKDDQIAQLEKLADPAKTPFRGGRGNVESVLEKQQQNADAPEGLEDQAAVEKREEIEWLVNKAKTTTDQRTKLQVLQKLGELCNPDEMAEVLTKTG